jgi:copper resistance protein B
MNIRIRKCALLAALLCFGMTAAAQPQGHTAATTTEEEEDADEPAAEPVDHAAMGHGTPPAAEPVDHAAMGHETPPAAEPVEHAAMGHGTPPAVEPVDHAEMGHGTPPAEEHVDHAAMGHGTPPSTVPVTPIPAVTAADRAAAAKPAEGHPAHDNTIQQFVLVDRFEGWDSDGHGAFAWEVEGWRGTDLNRLWVRSEGERTGGVTESADVELLFGRSVSPWWDVVGGLRHDFGEGPSQTFAAFGVQGLAPYKFEFAATAYVGQSGQTALRLEAEYDTLLTNRLILQWVAEAEAYGRSDERRGIGTGLNTFEAGMRLRYEVRREFAPYVGVVWERRFGDAADWHRAEGEDINGVRIVAGVRFWF